MREESRIPRMNPHTFRALIVRENPGRGFIRSVESRRVDDLPTGDVLVRVLYSSLNYKDALSATGNKGVTRKYPHTPGIDAAGIVETSGSSLFRAGDEVVITGNDLGSNTDGGFAGFVQVPHEWIVKCPAPLTLRDSMILGTAGYTAALSVMRLRHEGIIPATGSILVTGASGGVGCLAVAILAKLGYHVAAATGKREAGGFLQDLGAREILGREEIRDSTGKGLLPGRWAGVVDTVGGELLDSAIRQTRPGGAAATCGNVTSGEVRTSIYPFILRGVALLGINSAFTPMATREEIWDKLAGEWRLENLEKVVTEISLDRLDGFIDLILQGGVRGRVLVNLDAP